MSTGSTSIVTLFLVVLGLFMRSKGVLDWIFFLLLLHRVPGWMAQRVQSGQTFPRLEMMKFSNSQDCQAFICRGSPFWTPQLRSDVLSNLVRELFAASLSPSATAPAWRQLSVTVLARDQQCTPVMQPVTCMCPWVTHRSCCAESGHFCFIGKVGWGGSNNVWWDFYYI